MKLFRSIGIAIVAGAASVAALTTVAQAQTTSLDDVLQAARQERQRVARENTAREQAFVKERNTQQSKLNSIRSQVNSETAKSDQLKVAFDTNKARIEELTGELKEAQGEFAELFGAAKSFAEDSSVQLEGSLISSQFTGRTEFLKELAQSESLPSVEQLETLWLTSLGEMTEQSKVVTYSTRTAGADGQGVDTEMTRIGPFVAFNKDGFYTLKEGKLTQLSRQPREFAMAKNVLNHSGAGYVKGVIDPSRGLLLGLSTERSTIPEIIEQGGLVGKIILGILALGLVIGLFKLVTLWGVGGAVRGQVRKKTASKGNPLGRIMMAYQSNTSADVETLSLKLDDAVIRELPKLDSGLNLVKVLAAVAPLLGLLGTVIGMINTFQAITLFGTGDPQIMAGGISEALVTTVLGLIAAIPLLLIHALASASSKGVAQVLEEQAAGMIAEHAEARS